MRLPNSTQQAHAWVITTITDDFGLLDVWALPARGRREDFPAFLETLLSLDPANGDSAATRALFWLRLRAGALFGWDDPAKQRPVPGCTETTLAARLPENLRGSAPPRAGANGGLAGGFVPLYRTDDEWAAELGNETVHGVLHLAWVEQDDGSFRGQLAVYVKPRGRLGRVYMRLIDPFRHLVVYPALLRQIGRAWAARTP